MGLSFRDLRMIHVGLTPPVSRAKHWRQPRALPEVSLEIIDRVHGAAAKDKPQYHEKHCHGTVWMICLAVVESIERRRKKTSENMKGITS